MAAGPGGSMSIQEIETMRKRERRDDEVVCLGIACCITPFCDGVDLGTIT
jgi:hypothetical protein